MRMEHDDADAHPGAGMAAEIAHEDGAHDADAQDDTSADPTDNIGMQEDPAATCCFEHAPSHSPARLVYHADEEFQSQHRRHSSLFNNFTKGVKVSPDGLCMLTNSEDHILRLFEMFDEKSAHAGAAATTDHSTTTEHVRASSSLIDAAWRCVYIHGCRYYGWMVWRVEIDSAGERKRVGV